MLCCAQLIGVALQAKALRDSVVEIRIPSSRHHVVVVALRFARTARASTLRLARPRCCSLRSQQDPELASLALLTSLLLASLATGFYARFARTILAHVVARFARNRILCSVLTRILLALVVVACQPSAAISSS